MAIYSHGRENLGIKALRPVRGWYFPGMVSCLGRQTQLATCPSHWGKVTFKLTKSLEFGFVSPSALSHGVRCSPGSAVKNPPAVQETQETRVRLLGWEAPLEKGMASPVFLPGKCRGQRGLGGYSPWGRKEPDISLRLNNNKQQYTLNRLCKLYELEGIGGVL